MLSKLQVILIRLTFVVILAVLVLFLAGIFTEFVLAAIAAGILFYLSLPLTEFLEERKVPRIAAIFIVFIVFAGLIFFLLFYLIPIAIEEISSLALEVPQIFERFEEWIATAETLLGRRISEEQVQDLLGDVSARASNFLAGAATAILSALANVLSVLLVTVAGVVAAFYLLKDREKIVDHVRQHIPPESRPFIRDVAGGVNTVLSGFLRGQIIVAIIVGTLVGIALAIIGIPYAFALGVVAAVFEIIPYLGPILAAIPAVLFALSISPTTAIAVTAAFLVIQQVESLILSPRIVGAHVRLHPVTVIFAVLLGREILGVLGIFVAIPVAGVTKVLVERMLPPQSGHHDEEEQ